MDTVELAAYIVAGLLILLLVAAVFFAVYWAVGEALYYLFNRYPNVWQRAAFTLLVLLFLAAVSRDVNVKCGGGDGA